MGKSLFLDLDGTLADNLNIMYAVYEEFLETHGRAATRQEFDTLNGPALPEIVQILKKTHALEGTQEYLLDTYNGILDRSYLQAPAAPGAEAVLNAAREKGWTVGVVTSNTRQRTDAWLAERKISSLIDFVISRELSPRGKPAPDPYIKALERAECAAENACAVEDSLQGVQSALAAAIRTFYYSHDINRHVTFPAQAARLIHFNELISMIENHGKD